MRVKIAFHSENGPLIGGSDLYMGKLIAGLDPDSWDVHLLARPGYPLHLVLRDPTNVKLIPLGSPVSAGNPTGTEGGRTQQGRLDKALRAIRRLWQFCPKAVRLAAGLKADAWRAGRLLKSHQIAIMHTMDGGPQPVVLGARRAGCRVVSSYCGPPTPARRWLQARLTRASYSAADACIVKSRYQAEAWSRHIGVDGGKFCVIPNGVDVRRFAAGDLRRELSIERGAMVIGVTAVMRPGKGVETFVDAIPAIRNAACNARFIITGDGPERNAIESRVNSLGVKGVTHFLGFRSDIERVTNTYDVAVVPSTFAEPFGWTVVEAMAAAKPVVASRVGGIPEIVVHEITGLLVEPGNAERLADAVVQLVTNRPVAERMGTAALRRVSERYSQTTMLEAHLRLYKSLLGLN